MMQFPTDMGGDFAGLSFQQAFEQCPKWVEFVRTMWTENCTGIFLEFYKYVHLTLKISHECDAHEDRCIKYVKTLDESKIPKYLIKYKNVRRQIPSI
jgi:hypothetical protein|tara:strand:+ start:601 stop:891 length:291 start_codon:yes stop_codon:yes gene_type:complete